ncbi:MAG: T9SS type A sorting domain-containing protein [Cyclobacteriaceae bacterium]|jgi:hypothetical protein|nr:T9SS type A sorting domain-containing protein [Cyclobacteriaceae bacterium]
MNVLRYSILMIVVLAGFVTKAQNYTSIGGGNWATASNWNNTSGWGNATPQSGQASGTTNVNHTLTFTGNYSSGSATININSGAVMNVIGNFTTGGGSTVNVYGTLDISGNAVLNALLRIYPGGKVIIDGSLTVVSSNNLIVGTTAAPPPYADLIVKQDVISQTSGDVTVNRNGRVGIFGNVSGTGGGTLFTVNNGGQVYIDGNVNFSGGGSHIYNNNSTSPFGLYVNGTVTNSGGGSSITANRGDKDDLTNSNPSFFTWLAAQEGSPLPVELVYFKIDEKQNNLLQWATATQLNFSHFEVEHSVDGEQWNLLVEIKGEGNTNEFLAYSFLHQKPFSGDNYYRLKMVDLDNTFEYSTIIKAFSAQGLSVEVFPNPVPDKIITVSYNFEVTSTDIFSLLDLSGNIVWQGVATNFIGKIELPQTIMPGTYFLQFSSAGKNFATTKRLIIK